MHPMAFFQNDAAPSPDVPLFILRHRLKAAKSAAERLEISSLLSKELEVTWQQNLQLILRLCLGNLSGYKLIYIQTCLLITSTAGITM